MDGYVQKLKDEGNFIDAYLVAKNILSKDVGNPVLFQDYIDLALEIAMYNIVFDERKEYIADATSAMALFSETANMNDGTLSLIRETKAKIGQAYNEIVRAEQAYYDGLNAKIRGKNTEHLSELGNIYSQVLAAESQETFDQLLTKVTEVEEQLQKDAFSQTQEETYATLTKKYSQAISSKMEELNRKSLLDYNRRAVKCFYEVLNAFKTEPSKYKNESNLKALMTSKFFAFDSSKLFNETLIFYNHVYSVVFQEASDSMKYKLTEWALNTVKFKQ